VWRNAAAGEPDNGVEVAIIHRPRYDDWTIPKGKLVPGESDLEGAIREVVEETGYRVRVGRPLGEVAYEKAEDGHVKQKVVRYWSMFAEGGIFTPSREVDQLRWVSLGEARGLLTLERDRELLRRFREAPALTRTVLLVRHGAAGNRSDWKDDDRLRPLDETGQVQADALVWLLTRFEVRDIVSADYVRCVQTVEPLSEAVGLTIRMEPAFSEDGYEGRQAFAVRSLREIGSDGVAAVVCSQGGVIPDLLSRLATEDRLEAEAPFTAKKGSVWSLTFANRTLIAAEYFPPLAS
jgi:8-oxo-dGTP diphosphatase